MVSIISKPLGGRTVLGFLLCTEITVTAFENQTHLPLSLGHCENTLGFFAPDEKRPVNTSFFSCDEHMYNSNISARKLTSWAKGDSTSHCKRNKKRVERDPRDLGEKGWEAGGVGAVALELWPHHKHLPRGDPVSAPERLHQTFYGPVLVLILAPWEADACEQTHHHRFTDRQHTWVFLTASLYEP